MTRPVSRDVLLKLRKLAQLAADLRRGEHFEITRLTSLKSLCREPATANRFVTYLARKTNERVELGQGRSSHPDTPTDPTHRRMRQEALTQMEAWLRAPTETRRQRLAELLGQMRAEQNEYKRIEWGSVRIIEDMDLLLFEYALSCLLHPPHEAEYWAYQTARHYAERYHSRFSSGLVPASAPLVQDIVDFWADFFDLDPGLLLAPATQERTPAQAPSAHSPEGAPSARTGSRMKRKAMSTFTHRQGQFLAFIHLYGTLHRRGPAELDMVKFFGVTPPTVHGMVVKLEELDLITREPGVARSVRVAIPREEIPTLEEVRGPPW